MNKENLIEIIDLLSNSALEHTETMKHSIRCSCIIGMFSDYLGLNKELKEKLIKGALLHDIGKYKIPKEILYKSTKLTENEIKIIKGHVDNIDMQVLLNNMDIEIVKMQKEHHEKINGTGYPKGLNNDEISLYGKLMAIIDIFDALYSKRSYKEAFELKEIIAIFEKEKGETLDYLLTNLFIKFLIDNANNINLIDFSQ